MTQASERTSEKSKVNSCSQVLATAPQSQSKTIEMTLDTSTSNHRPDIAKIMEEIRQRIKAGSAVHKDRKLEFKSFKADLAGKEAVSADQIVNSEELRALNRSYGYASRVNLDAVSSHRGGFIGRCIVAIKRKAARILRDSLLKDYLQAETEHQATVVRFLNDVSRYIGARDSGMFWELIHKIDYDVGKALTRIEQIGDEKSAEMHALERRVRELTDRALADIREDGTLDQHEVRLKTLESVADGLEAIVSKLKPTLAKQPSQESAANGLVSAQENDQNGDYSYLLLENRFRGSQAEISKRLEIYPPLFSAASLPVLEIGSGRGELQLLFKQQGVLSYGVDMDAAMVESCADKGIDVRLGDAISHLRTLEDGSLGGVIAVQVVEHLSRSQLEELFQLCAKKIARGGIAIFETINPRSLLALSSNYFRDPTHVWPLHPDTLEYCATLSGLKVREVKLLSPVAQGSQLQELTIDEHLPPRWAMTLAQMNNNIRQLNSWLYGNQDYCIITEVP